MKCNLIKICLLAALLLPRQSLVEAWGQNSVAARQQAVSGIVTDKGGEPLVGVTVQPVGRSGGTVTSMVATPSMPRKGCG